AIDSSTLAAVPVHRGAHDDDEFHVAWHPGHVPDFPAAATPVLANGHGQPDDDFQYRRDRGRPVLRVLLGPARPSARYDHGRHLRHRRRPPLDRRPEY